MLSAHLVLKEVSFDSVYYIFDIFTHGFLLINIGTFFFFGKKLMIFFTFLIS